jgi:IS5 family transposase
VLDVDSEHRRAVAHAAAVLSQLQDGASSVSAPTRHGKGVKIMAIVDRNGLPLSVSTHAANHHEVTLVQLSFDFYMIEAKPEKLIGDKTYDSDALDEALKQQGVEMLSPHRSNRTLKTRDGRRLRRYARRWLVERFFRMATVEASGSYLLGVLRQHFLGFVELASITMLLKRI